MLPIRNNVSPPYKALISRNTYTLFQCQVSQQNNTSGMFFIQHLPEICNCFLHWSLSNNECILLLVTLEFKKKNSSWTREKPVKFGIYNYAKFVFGIYIYLEYIHSVMHGGSVYIHSFLTIVNTMCAQ